MNTHQNTNELKAKSLSLANLNIPASLDRLMVNLTTDKFDKCLEMVEEIKSQLSELEKSVKEMREINL